MLALAIVHLRQDHGTYQASDETWSLVLMRLKNEHGNKSAKLAATTIERSMDTLPPKGKQRRITFPYQEAMIVWDVAAR